MTASQIRMYGTPWCGDCTRARRFLDTQSVPYDYIDIISDPEAAKIVEQHNHGNRSVPTIVFSDGSVLVEPSESELSSKVTST